MENWLETLIEHEARYFAFVTTIEKMPFAWFLHNAEIPDYRDANHALRLRDDGRGAEAIARAVINYYRSRGLNPIADVDEIAEGQGIGAALRRLGCMPVVSSTLLMRCDSETAPIAANRGVEVVNIEAQNRSDLRPAWIETVCSDFQDDHEAMWRTVIEREAHYALCTHYVGLLNETPAGACDLFVAESWGRVESVVTRAEFRRRGVASAVVAQAVADSLNWGSRVTYLFTEAGGAGEQVYRKLGFVPWKLNALRRHILR